LYKSVEKVFNSSLAGLMAGVVFIIWLDNVHWNTTTMTESITRSIFCFVVYVVANWKNRLRDTIALALLMIVVFLTRPTGIIPIIGAFVFVIVYNWKSLVEKPPRLVSVALISTAAIIFGADRMLAHWDFTGQYLKGNVVTFADLVKGPLLHETLSVEPPSSRAFADNDSPIGRVVMFIYDNPVHFLKTAGLKIFYLIAFVRPYYSWPHNLYLVMWISLIYMFLVVGWRTTSNLPIKLFVLTTIILNCALIGISSVDWDNRFYIPMEPGIVLLAGGGVAALLNRIRQKSLSTA